jgi:NAD(P)-dependent dehydrogenase (short-subunit alcohol dehydrogenase family)
LLSCSAAAAKSASSWRYDLADGARVILAARGSHGLDDASHRLRAAGATAVYTKDFDADDFSSHDRVLQEIAGEHGPIGTAVLAFGVLGDQAQAEIDAAHAVGVVHTDYVSQINLLTLLAQRMRLVSSGRIVAFSSIAGARCRHTTCPAIYLAQDAPLRRPLVRRYVLL